MTDLKEQARRLIELDGARMLPGGNDEYCYFAILYAPAIAQAYLDQCEEIERLREALRFYADDDHKLPNEGPWGVSSDDFGQVARKALGDTDEG